MTDADLIVQLLSKENSSRDPSDLQVIAKYLESLKFIADMKEETSEETVHSLAACIKTELFSEGEVSPRQTVFREGDRGTKFYIILSGEVSFYISVTTKDELTLEEEISQLKVKSACTADTFGELALLQDKPRAATVICDTDCCFGVVSKEDYNKVIGQHSQKLLQTKLAFLELLPIFSGWRRHNIAKLTYSLIEESFVLHKVVFKENEPSDSIFIVRNGEFRLIQTLTTVNDGPLQRRRFTKLHIASLGVGELIGVSEVIDKRSRKYTCVCASSRGTLLRLSEEVGAT
jgi:CRP-like cAMP-binding protein